MENCCLPNVAPPGRSSAVMSTSICPPKLMGILVRTEADKRTDRSDPSVPSYRLIANPALTTLCRVCGGSDSSVDAWRGDSC